MLSVILSCSGTRSPALSHSSSSRSSPLGSAIGFPARIGYRLKLSAASSGDRRSSSERSPSCLSFLHRAVSGPPVFPRWVQPAVLPRVPLPSGPTQEDGIPLDSGQLAASPLDRVCPDPDDPARQPSYCRIGLTAGSWLLGVWGMVRLLRTWGVAAVAGTLAGVVYISRSGAQAIAQHTECRCRLCSWPHPLGYAFLAGSVPAAWLGRAARVAAVAAISGVVAVFAPLALLIAPSVLARLGAPQRDGPSRLESGRRVGSCSAPCRADPLPVARCH